METIKARFNCGYWIWDCPTCNSGNRATPKDKMVLCHACYKGMRKPRVGYVDGTVITGYSKEDQDNAKRLAWANEEVYKLSFPRNHKQIMEVLRCREEKHMSWDVGESIEDLKAENLVLGYFEIEDIIEEEEIIVEEELPELDDKTLREIK